MKPRRGVSEILATMIVLMIVSSLGVMLYNLSTSSLSSQQTNLLSQVETQKDAEMEKFDIISITRNSTSDSILIYYIDYGTVSPKISSVYLECASQGLSPQILPPFKDPLDSVISVENKPSTIHCITLDLSSLNPSARSLIDNSYVTYKIVSQRGNSIVSQN